MPRTRSSKKPGCFNQMKPPLTFTESPPDRLPRRLCSPLSTADNPVTAKVLHVEDGLETTWVSPQFQRGMLERDEQPKTRKKRRKKDEEKSSMASQPTRRMKRPVPRKSSCATPGNEERRFPKGFQVLEFVADAERKKRDEEKKKMMRERMEEEDADVGRRRRRGDEEDEDVRIDGGNNDYICNGASDTTSVETTHRGRRRKTDEMQETTDDDERMDVEFDDASGYHDNTSSNISGHSRQKSTRLRIPSSKANRKDSHHHNRDVDRHADDCDEEQQSNSPCFQGEIINRRLTMLKRKSQAQSTNLTDDSNIDGIPGGVTNIGRSRRSKCNTSNGNDSNRTWQSPGEGLAYNASCRQNLADAGLSDWDNAENGSFHESPKLDRSRMKLAGVNLREEHTTLSIGNSSNGKHCLLSEVNLGGHSVVCGGTGSRVLAADTPVSDYGLRVDLRRRRDLLPENIKKLLIDL